MLDTTSPPAAPPPAAPKIGIGASTFILITVLLDAAGIGLIMPVLPDLLVEFSHGGGIAGAAAIGGWLAFSYAGMQFLCAPGLGALSDRFGRRPILLASMAAMAVDYAIMAGTGALWALFAARIMSGAAGATMSAARSWVADRTSAADRARHFGRMGAAMGLGFALGPALGGLLGELGPRAPFWAAALLAAANLILGLVALPESLGRDRRRAAGWRDADPLRALRRAAVLPGLGALLAVGFLYELGVQAYPAVWSFVGIAAWEWSPAQIGLSLTVYGVLSGASQAFLVAPAIRMFGERRALIIALAADIVGAVGVGLATDGWMVYALMPLLGASAITHPALYAMISSRAPDGRQGEIQGVLASLAGIAAVISPLAMTAVFAAFVGPGAIMALPGAPFVLTALILCGALALFVRATRR
ncbi:MAG: DHA1 family tetracycline resistance protein-like MFS transporter [Paracoccaceae bacterium]|jgi:DHA1 family tetracycline resistance protein-like MFS transporter